MIEITHTPYEGTVARGVPKDARLTKILIGAGWRWVPPMDTWRLPRSRNRAADQSPLESTAADLRRAGFEVSLRVDEPEEPTAASYSNKWVGRQIHRLETNLGKVDRQLEHHFRTIESAGTTSSVEADVWAIRLLLRRTELVDELGRWQEVQAEMAVGAPVHTPETVQKGDFVRISGHWRKVARVNPKSVTVEIDNSHTGRAPYYDITGHRPADEPDL